MKLNILETHDRLEHFKKEQNDTVLQGCQDCLKKNSLSLAIQERSPYLYIFAHPRTADDGFTKILYWQPRLSRPKAQTNSYLFRAISKTDLIEICWIIPPRELWPEYKTGNVMESDTVTWSIRQFQYNRAALEAPLQEDCTEEQFQKIMKSIAADYDSEKRIRKIYSV